MGEARAADPTAAARARMVEGQLAARGVRDARVLHAFGEVPRHVFVPAELADRAYDDRALPLGQGQTISQPYVVALMLEALELRDSERVLESAPLGLCGGAARAALRRGVHDRASARAGRRGARAAGGARRRERARAHGRRHGRLARGRAVRRDPGLGGRTARAAAAAGAAARGRPTGDAARSRTGRAGLVRIVRAGPDAYPRENLGAVQFVPLVGRDA
jgi:protein-L-isoaspartate(D-aspartate) O-methyltransferase